MTHLFIAHANTDDAFARQLRAALEAHPFPVWVDTRNLRGVSKLAREVEEAIKSAGTRQRDPLHRAQASAQAALRDFQHDQGQPRIHRGPTRFPQCHDSGFPCDDLSGLGERGS